MNTNDPRAKRTRKMIIDAFAKLLQNKNAESITVKELVTEAGLSRATFYLHFEDMPSFLQELTNDTIDDLINYAISGNNDAMESAPTPIFYKRFFDYILDNQLLFKGMLSVHGYPLFRQKFIQYGVDGYLAQLAPHRASFEKDVSLEMLAHYIGSAHTGIVEYWLNEGCKYSSQYMAKQIQYLTIDSLKPIADLKGALILPR